MRTPFKVITDNYSKVFVCRDVVGKISDVLEDFWVIAAGEFSNKFIFIPTFSTANFRLELFLTFSTLV